MNTKEKEFNNFRFAGLGYSEQSNKYFTMNRVSTSQDRIVVRVGDAHLISTKYGYALILDKNHVVFLKDWQVNQNYFGNEVLLFKEYFDVRQWGDFEEFDTNEENYKYETWLNAAREQNDAVDADGEFINRVRWEK